MARSSERLPRHETQLAASQAVVELKEMCLKANVEQLKHNIDKEKRNLDLTIFTCFTEYKKKIDVNLKMNCEDDVDVLHSLVFDFFEFLRTVIQISVWLEDHSDQRINSLYNHFVKFAFESKDKASENCQYLKNDLDYFWNRYLNYYNYFNSTFLLVSDIQMQFKLCDHVLISTGDSYSDCLKNLQINFKDLIDSAGMMTNCNNLKKLNLACGKYSFTMADISDNLMQIAFFAIVGSMDCKYLDQGKIVKKLQRTERLSLFPNKKNEILKDIVDLLHSVPQLREVYDCLKNQKSDLKLHEVLCEIRRNCQIYICSCDPKAQGVNIAPFVLEYMNVCLLFIEIGAEYLNDCHNWFSGKDTNLDMSRLCTSFEDLMNKSRNIAWKQKLTILLSITEYLLVKIDTNFLIAPAISFTQNHQLNFLSHSWSHFIFDNFDGFVAHVNNLKQLLSSLHVLLNCAASPEEMRQSFNSLIKRYVHLVTLENCDEEKKTFVTDVEKFISKMSSDLNAFLNVMQLGQDRCFDDQLAQLFPHAGFGTPVQTIILNFLISEEMNLSTDDLGVEIRFLDHSKKILRFHRVQAIRNFSDSSRHTQCRFKIPKGCSDKLYYRYTICYVPEMLSTTRTYEFQEITDCFRVLHLPFDEDSISTFDSLIHQRILKQTNVVIKFFARAIGYQEFEIPDRKNELHRTLQLYFDETLKSLENSSVNSIESVNEIYTNLKRVTEYSGKASVANLSIHHEVLLYQDVPATIAWKLINEVLTSLSTSTNPNRVVSGLIVCRYIVEINIIKKKQLLSRLISVFSVTINENENCPEYNVIKKIFYTGSCKDNQFMNAFWTVLKVHINESGMKISNIILRSLPLMNWFYPPATFGPFAMLPASLDQLQSCYDISVSQMHGLIPLSKSEIENIKQANVHLFKADILLQFLLVRVCPKNGYHQLFEIVHSPVVLVCLGKHLKESKPKCTELFDVLQCFMKEKEKLLSQFKHVIWQILIFILEEGIKLQIYKSVEKDINMIRSLVLMCIQVFMFCDKSKVMSLNPFIQWWAKSKFGEFIGQNKDDWQGKIEQKLWTDLFEVDVENEVWKQLLTDLIQSRYNKNASFDEKLKLLMSLEDKNQSIAFTTVNKMIEPEIKEKIKAQTQILPQSTNTCFQQSPALRLILCKNMEDMFPEPMQIDFSNILTWKFWPIVLTAIQKYPEIVGARCVTYLSTIRNLLENTVASYLKEEEFTVAQIFQIKKNWDSHLVKVFCALNLGKELFNDILMNCLQKVQIFELFVKLSNIFLSSRITSQLHDMLSSISKKFSMLSGDYMGIKIKDLCQVTKDDSYTFPCFEEVDQFIHILIPFSVLNSKYFDNDIFRQSWSEFFHARKSLQIEDIVPHIWIPALQRCRNILLTLENENMTISESRKTFGSKETTDNVVAIWRLQSAISVVENLGWAELSQSIQSEGSNSICIEEVMSSYSTKLVQKPKWIDCVANKMNEWSSVDKLTDSADVVLKVVQGLEIAIPEKEQETLELFSSMKIHVLEEMMIKEMNIELSTLRVSLVKIKSIDFVVLMIIKLFCEQSELRKWIQEKSRSFYDMEKFISVASGAIVGESDMVHDRLSDLRTICNKFAVLLYHLPPNGNVQIQEVVNCICKCAQKLSDCLTTIDINCLLKACMSNLNWYISQGEIQGSVAKGAVKDLEDINNFGQYTVKLCRESNLYSITLNVSSDDEMVTCKQWELNELQELESKLVLITRETSDWIDSKNLFQATLQQVIRIADMVQRMNDYGYQRYLEKNIEILCHQYASDIDLKRLFELTDNLANELCSWINHVWLCRQKYYHLNFYTNQQLVILKNEIEILEKDPNAVAGSQLFSLLHSITGRFFRSTFFIRQILCGEEETEFHHLDDDELTSQNYDSLVQSSMDLEPSQQDLSDEDALDKAINELNEVQKSIFAEMVDMDYEKELVYEAVNQEENTNIFNAIDWCDNKSLDMEYISSLHQKWQTGSHTEILIEENSFSQSYSDEVNSYEYSISEIGRVFAPFHEGNHSKMTSVVFFGSNSLENLGIFLQKCANFPDVVVAPRRRFPSCFDIGKPNLVVVNPENVFLAVLHIYFEDEEKPLPCFDEVLLCSAKTTLEEVGVFLMRAIYDPEQARIYCLVHAEKLKYLIAEKAMDLIDTFSQGRSNYRLIVICSSEREQKSIPVSRLQAYRRKLPNINFEDIQKYAQNHLCNSNHSTRKKVFASDVDADNFRVRLVSSNASGVGKTLYIRRMKERLVKHLKEFNLIGNKSRNTVQPIATIPLHGPIVTVNEVLSMLLNIQDNLQSSIIHLDIPQKVIRFIDDILFSLIFLQGLCNTDGQIWRCLPSQYYLIETVIPNDKHYLNRFSETKRVLSILNLLPNSKCIMPKQIISSAEAIKSNEVGIDKTEMYTPMYQRVYQYLNKIYKNDDLENFKYAGTMQGDEKQCLEMIMRHFGVDGPTWKEIRHFVWFLNAQLSACEQSNLLSKWKGLKDFVANFMIIMSKDFATSSIGSESNSDKIKQHEVSVKSWNERINPYLFFNKNRTSVTYVGMQITKAGNAAPYLEDNYKHEPIDVKVTPEVLKFLANVAKMPQVDASESTTQEQSSSVLLNCLAEFLNIKDDNIESLDTSYVLTQDNLTKIMGIQMRFRCRIPVVLMGETGCGKTHLIRFMCQFAKYNNRELQNMFILKIHGGTTESEVIRCIEAAERKALENRKFGIETVVFFDEANTSEVISLIKEVMCDGRCRGKSVPPFLRFIAACNPYREHDKVMKEKLKSAGLGWKESNAIETLGEIPMRDLVYRVLELPASMRALVYDFGSLSEEIEPKYIYEIVKNRIYDGDIIKSLLVIEDISNTLSSCQKFMRASKDECSFVSLRDVERAAIVFNYFYNKFLDIFQINSKYTKLDCSVVLTISVCYHSRIENRENFEKHITNKISEAKSFLKVNVKDFKNILSKYQLELLNCMQLHANIARNAALRENVFMMVVCIELRIPLFLVGKPGSSKSLAKSIISDSMHGEDNESTNNFLKKFKKIHLCSHQCSPLSTPGSIIEVFNKAKFDQTKENVDKFASVVVLDEVGLAEASPHLPLKALHPLLEDGTEGSSKTSKENGSESASFFDKRYERNERVAFIGISNWALDPAKMNRGIMVTRGDPGIPELIESASGICSTNKVHNLTFQRLEYFFPLFSKAYKTISTTQKRQFFGLRDFYSLIKMLYWMTDKSETKLTKAQLLHAIKRNFDGYDSTELDPVKEFQKTLTSAEYDFSNENGDLVSLRSFSGEYLTVCNDNLVWSDTCSKDAQFIVITDATLSRKVFQSLMNNDRYLGCHEETNELVLTTAKGSLEILSHDENKEFVYLNSRQGKTTLNGVEEFCLINPVDPITNPDCTPLGLIKASLQTKDTTWHGENRYLLFLTENYSALQTLKQYIIATTETVESEEDFCEPFVLFGSSFPKDNEYSQVCRNIGEVRLCMETGRMVILLNLENLYESLYDVLNQYYFEFNGRRYVELGLRTNRMKCSVHEKFKLILIAEKDKVYKHFPTPLVNRMEKHFVSSKTVLNSSQRQLCELLEKWIEEITGSDRNSNSRVEDVFIGYNSDTVAAVVLQASSRAMLLQGSDKGNKEASVVFKMSKELLLQLASPDGICRYKPTINNNKHEVDTTYFINQEHSSLSNLFYRLSDNRNGQLIQITSHAHTLSQNDISVFAKQLECNNQDIIRLHLESFHTEQDFINSVRNALQKGFVSQNILLLECDSGHNNGNLISCCRYRIVDILNDENLRNSNTCILFLIHLPRKYPKSTFVSFQELPWHCYHVDELISDHSSMQLSDVALANYSVSEIFNSEVNDYPPVDLKDEFSEVDSVSLKLRDLQKRGLHYCEQLHYLVPQAVSYCSMRPDRIQILQTLIPQQPTDQDILYKDIISLIKIFLDSETHHHENWVLEEALNVNRLEETGSFRRALIEKLKQIIVPAFAHVLSFIDQHDNLNILEHGNEHQKQAWNVLFRNERFCHEFFTNNADCQTDISITCQFPFSWVIYEFCKEAITSSINSNMENFEREKGDMKMLLDQLPIGLTDLYLNDFVKLCYKCSNTDTIFKVIVSVTQNMMENSTMTKFDSKSQFDTMMNIHLVHKKNVHYFDWFLKLVSQVPSILQDTEYYQNKNIKEVVSVAVDKTLSSAYFDLRENFVKGKTALRGWIQKLYGMQAMIESILKSSFSNPARLHWKWMCIRRMFVEHIVLKNEEEMLFVMKRIEKMSERKEQLESENTLNVLVTFLTAVEQGLQKGKVKSIVNRNAIHQSCWMLFKEALMLYCFDNDDPISSEKTISDLVNAVFSTNASSRISHFIQFHMEENVALQIWVLKSICTFSEKYPETHLQGIFSMISNLSHENDNWIDCNDSKYTTILSLYGFFDLQSKPLQSCLFTNGINDFQQHMTQPTSPFCLKAIAQIHHSCQTLAMALHKFSAVNESDMVYFSELLSKDELNDDASCTGPFWYLLRLIAKKYGLSTLIKASNSTEFDWITSHEIFENETEMWHYLDPAAIYNPIYERLRSCVSELFSGSSSSVLNPKVLHSQQAIPLILAIYERIRQSHVCSMLPSKQIEKMEIVNQFVTDCTIYKPYPEILEIIKNIASNTHCDQLPQMTFRPEESHEDYIIRTLVVHAVTALIIGKSNKATKIFSDILLQPEIFKTHSLPTVHSVGTSNVQHFLAYPECRNFHRHTTAMINQHCPSCGSKIMERAGPDPNYDCARSIDMSNTLIDCTGSVIGFVSPVSYGIIRSILHCCLLWTSCQNMEIATILKLPVDNLPLYFWNQIKANIKCVHEGTGRSIDDVVMIIHMVIQEIVKFSQVHITHEAIPDKIVEKIVSVDDHQQWELQFHRLFINPVLNNLAEKMNQLFDKLSDRDHNRLFSSLYLFEKLPNSESDAAQWQYHPNVTMNHFLLNNINLEFENNHPALFYMITEIDSIEATKYICDIVHLLRNVHDVVMHKYSLSNKQTLENMEFTEFLSQNISEKQRKNVKERFESLCQAWKMSHSSIYMQNHFKLDEKFKEVDLTMNTKMACLIPTMQADGLLTVALLDHLIWTHNCIVQKSRQFVKTTLEREWLLHARKVHIVDFNSSDYIDCKDKLFHFVMKHSTYVFQSGSPYIKYDVFGLEKDLVCQCVLDKSVIIGHADMPQVVWEMSSAILAISIVEQKIPQKELSRQAAVDILSELKTIAQLTDVINTIETTLKFLKSEELQKATGKLKSYIEHLHLQLNSITIGQHCQLENINYLWKLLNIEKEKLHCRNHETPFSNTSKLYLTQISGTQAAQLSESLRNISNLEHLIWPLYNFIQLVVKHHDPNDEFYNAVKAFQAENKQEVTKYKDVLIEEFKVKHAVDIWKHIILYQDKLKKQLYY